MAPTSYKKSAEELVVLGMGADPEPVHTARNGHTERAIAEVEANAVEAAVPDELQVKGRMRWVRSELSVALAKKFLHVGRLRLQALPNAPRGRVSQGSRADPD